MNIPSYEQSQFLHLSLFQLLNLSPKSCPNALLKSGLAFEKKFNHFHFYCLLSSTAEIEVATSGNCQEFNMSMQLPYMCFTYHLLCSMRCKHAISNQWWI